MIKHDRLLSLLTPALLVFVFLSVCPAPVFAIDDPEDEIVIAEAEALDASTMANTRGAYRDPTGHIYRFAVDIRTRIDGAISYARSLVLQSDSRGDLHATSSAKLETVNLPTGTIANIINNGGGLVVEDTKGNTTVLNQTPTGSIASVVVNSANDRVVSQTVDINILLKNITNLVSNSGALRNLSALSQSVRTRMLGIGR